MNTKKLFSIIILVTFISLLESPTSDAINIHKVAKLGAVGAVGALAAKGALLGGAVLLKAPLVPIVAKKVLLAKALGGAAIVGGLAGAKAGAIASKAKIPLLSGLGKGKLQTTLSIPPALPPLPQAPISYSPPLLSQPPSYSRPSFSSGGY